MDLVVVVVVDVDVGGFSPDRWTVAYGGSPRLGIDEEGGRGGAVLGNRRRVVRLTLRRESPFGGPRDALLSHGVNGCGVSLPRPPRSEAERGERAGERGPGRGGPRRGEDVDVRSGGKTLTFREWKDASLEFGSAYVSGAAAEQFKTRYPGFADVQVGCLLCAP